MRGITHILTPLKEKHWDRVGIFHQRFFIVGGVQVPPKTSTLTLIVVPKKGLIVCEEGSIDKNFSNTKVEETLDSYYILPKKWSNIVKCSE